MAWHPDDGLRFDKAHAVSCSTKALDTSPFRCRSSSHLIFSLTSTTIQQPNYSRYSISSIRQLLRNLLD